ncbi:Mbeg1-like protein, partial [Streptococcus suis]
EIPAQRAASGYLEKLMMQQGGHFYLAGHSKGGNLALYAACQQAPELQERILAIYPFDAPGLHKKHLDAPGYKNIQDRIHPIIPQNSIVGMMLETPENAQIVQSNTLGILQHISFSWEVDGSDFKLAPALTSDSLQTDQALKTWTASLTDDELRDFFDLFFGIFIKAG